MTSRSTQKIVHFSSPFALDGLDALQPAGDYVVNQDEELLEGASHLAWRRVATFIHLPAIAANSLTRHMVPVDPAVLENALQKDQEQP